MKNLAQLLLGLLAAAGSSLIILAAASLALVEGGVEIAAVPSPTQALVQPTAAPPGAAVLPTASHAVMVITPTEYLPTACPAPAGWALYIIQPGDTIESLAAQSNLPADEFRRANCLVGNSLIPNSVLFIPAAGVTKTATEIPPTPLPTLPATITPVPCGPPYGWILYIVRPGDTIFRLSLAFGVTQDMLLRANCMTGTALFAGQTLFVPNVPTRVPTSTPVIPTLTIAPTQSITPSATTNPTATATQTAEPTANPTATEAPTATSEPTSTVTATQTTEPTATSSPTAEPTSTVTAGPNG